MIQVYHNLKVLDSCLEHNLTKINLADLCLVAIVDTHSLATAFVATNVTPPKDSWIKNPEIVEVIGSNHRSTMCGDALMCEDGCLYFVEPIGFAVVEQQHVIYAMQDRFQHAMSVVKLHVKDGATTANCQKSKQAAEYLKWASMEKGLLVQI